MGNLQDDIIKYRKGELSPKEMHALEKKALSDPFLAEALEGLENISSQVLSEDVEELNRKILKERKKTILFTPLRIAAGVILVSVSIFLFYQLLPKHETIALKTEKKEESPGEKKQTPVGEAKKNDLVPSENSTQSNQQVRLSLQKAEPKEGAPKIEKSKAVVDKPREEEKGETKVEMQPVIAEQKEVLGPEKKPEDLKVEVQQNAPVIVQMEPAKEIVSEDLKKESRAVGRAKKNKFASEGLVGAGLSGKTVVISRSISGRVISAEDGQPLPGVNVLLEGTTNGTVTDADGNFTLKDVTENQRLVFSFIGMESKEVSLDEKDKVDVELKNDLTQLSEVVVTGLSVPKEEDDEPIIHLASPVGGKKAYNKYLDANARYPKEALKNNIKGKVRVEFTVHTDGSFDQYKVVKSLGSGCDEEVIRLIKEGPKWSPTTENGRPIESTVRVGVKFDPSMAGR